MKIIYNKVLPFGRGLHALNLFGVIFAKGLCDDALLNYENIHTAQMKELFYVGFYILYLLEWVVRLLQYRSFAKSYENISFEREAYAHQHDRLYLKDRKPYAFVRHLRSSSAEAVW